MGILDLFKPNVEKLEDRKDVKGSIDILKRKDNDLRRKSANALGRIGESAISP